MHPDLHAGDFSFRPLRLLSGRNEACRRRAEPTFQQQLLPIYAGSGAIVLEPVSLCSPASPQAPTAYAATAIGRATRKRLINLAYSYMRAGING
jgi:hypothetical protein